MPPSPEHIPLMIKQTFVDKGMLNMDDVKALKDIYLLHKGITYGQITAIKGTDVDAWQNKAERFLVEMTSLIAKMIEAR